MAVLPRHPSSLVQHLNVNPSWSVDTAQENEMNYDPFRNKRESFYFIDFPEALHSNKSCQIYRFIVMATNGAGGSVPTKYLETTTN